MRVVICSAQPILVKALVDRLLGDGHEALGIMGSPDTAHFALRRYRPEVVVTDDWPPGTDELVDDIPFSLVLLRGEAARSVSIPSGRAGIVAPHSARLPEIVTLIGDVGTAAPPGDRLPARLRTVPAARPTGSRTLARFLSSREREVLSELVRGADTATLAHRLSISRSTARDHIQSVLTKMNVHSRLELVSMAVREGLVDPTTGQWLEAG
jgi:two-component system, NarL family, nitrate/nitrite response regulator NarL